jgi:hypothetical protein
MLFWINIQDLKKPSEYKRANSVLYQKDWNHSGSWITYAVLTPGKLSFHMGISAASNLRNLDFKDIYRVW